MPSGPIAVNQTATIQCDDGYKVTGLPTVTCVLTAGKSAPNWNATIAGCKSECMCALACWLNAHLYMS